MTSQKEVWDKIAPEWYEFKTGPSERILEFLAKQKGKVLDLGSGAGRHLVEIKDGKMYLVDFSSEMIKLAEKRAQDRKVEAEFAVSELSKLPYEDNFFDSAISIAALHCVEGKTKRQKAAEELFRVLKPGATAKITVWNKDTKRFKNSPKKRTVGWRDKGRRYYYLFSADEFYELFEKEGFEIIEKIEPGRNLVIVVKKPIS